MSRVRGSTGRITFAAALGLVLTACGDGPTVVEPPVTPTLDAELRRSLQSWGIVPIGSTPAQDPALVELGRALFFDPVLSGNRDVSCATCHHPAMALGDGRSLPAGTGGTGLGPERTPGPDRVLVSRSAPSLLNSGLGMPYLFWDGRIAWGQLMSIPATSPEPVVGPLPGGLSHDLAAQALLPLLDRIEMRGRPGDRDVFGAANELADMPDDQHQRIWGAIVDRLVAIPGYVELFGSAFPEAAGDVRIQHVARALAAFQIAAFTRTDSPFDRYLARDDDALTTEQKRGALSFFGDARCGTCHGGPFLGGQSFANVGVPQIGPGVAPEAPRDVGRGALFPGDAYRFAFRVPPLRNVELTAPYMHNGAFPTLEAVVRHYDDVETSLRGFDPSHLAPDVGALHHGDAATVDEVLFTLDGRLGQPLELTDDEVAGLVTFLESLTDPSARDLEALVPTTVPSGLAVAR